MSSNQTNNTLALPKTTAKEKFAYALGDVGCNFIWAFTSSFLVLYYTDSAGLTAAFVGTMMLVSRILDGASDITMGLIIEKTKSRWGKARPWLLWGSIPFAISLILVMNVPGGLNESAKHIYAYITYIFMVVFCYTAVNLAYHAMLPRFCSDPQDRNTVSVVRLFCVIFVALIISIITPNLLQTFGGIRNQSAWSTVAAIYASLAIICLLINFLVVKEKVPLTVTETKNKVPLKLAATAIFKNKYFVLTLGLFVFNYIGSGIGGIQIYFARDVLGNAGLFGIIMLAGAIPMLIAQLILPSLFKRFGKRTVCMFFTLFQILSGVLILSNPFSLYFVLIAFSIRGFGTAALAAVIFTFSADIVDYGEWKTGIRAEGFAYSSTSFGMKVGTGLGAAILGWSLSASGYIGALETQTQQTVQGIVYIATIPFIIISIIVLILLFLWDFHKVPIHKKSENNG